jgi:hypothetical protein
LFVFLLSVSTQLLAEALVVCEALESLEDAFELFRPGFSRKRIEKSEERLLDGLQKVSPSLISSISASRPA